MGYFRVDGWAFYEALGVMTESFVQDVLALLSDGVRPSVMDTGGCHKRQGTVSVVVIVPVEEASGPVPGGFQTGKALREGVVVLDGFELGL